MPWNLGCPQLDSDAHASAVACVWSTDAEQYRRLQEIAYVNVEGASASSVVALMLAYPLIISLHQLIGHIVARHCTQRWARVISEFLLAVLPLTSTFSAPHLVWKSIATLVAVCIVAASFVAPPLVWPRLVNRFLAARALRRADGSSLSFTYTDAAGKRLRFLAEYRAIVMITTCIGILAVDFPAIFSRTHAKTEEYGFALMDLGTGCAVCVAAVCSHASRRGSQRKKDAGRVWGRILSLWPVLLLGFIRLLVLWGVDYHVPTSEYGVHWNFFFTIAVVNLVFTALDLGPAESAVAGAVVLINYQLFLSFMGGANYILNAERVSLFSANREGIFSCIGFLSIHWIAVGIGGFVQSAAAPVKIARGLLLGAGVCIVATLVLSYVGLPASRRMCNFTYAIFVVGVNALVMSLLAWLDLMWPVPREPLNAAYSGVDASMFATFLLANLFTGTVNLVLQPLLVPAFPALLIMALYTLAWTVPFGVLHSRGIALKFW